MPARLRGTSCRSPRPSRRSSTRCRRTGRTSSSTCASTRSRYIDAATLARPGQRPALLPPRLALADPRRAPVRPRRRRAHHARDAASWSTRPASGASWCCASCAPAASRRPRGGGARVGPPGVPPHPLAVVARVVAVFDDLLLGSNVLGMLRAAGHEAGWPGRATWRAAGADVLVVDLGSEGFDGVALVEGLRALGAGTRDARGLLPRAPRGEAPRRGRRGSTSWSRARAWRARVRRWWSGSRG